MTRPTILLISLLLGCQLHAQNFLADWFGGPSRKELHSENDRLRESLDSLQILVDSLEQSYSQVESELFALIEGNSPEADSVVVEYTPEMTDSLLHLWYKNSFQGDFEIVNEYDMDSVHFTSDVSDAEIEKRLADMNSFISLPYNDVVKNYIILYSEKMRTQMGRIMGLSQYYFPVFEEVFVRYGLPVELKYMAIVESMLNPVARSRAGASGMWQFMYSTARSYGLEINSYVDERLDVEKSVDAAARYLRDAYRIFGDWTLAISSYNCGAGNVSKAIRRAGGARDFWSIYPFLPRETRGYVPAFVGAMYAMTYWREYGIVPQDVGMPAKVDTFEIRRNLHFDQISAVVGVPREDLENLNPQYLHDIIPGSSHSYILKLPYTWTGAFVEVNRDSLYAFKADSLMSSRIQKEVADAIKNNGRIAYKGPQRRLPRQDRPALRSHGEPDQVMEQPALIQHTRRPDPLHLRAQDPRGRTGVKRHGGRQDHGEPLRPLDLHHLQGQERGRPLQHRQTLSRSDGRRDQGGQRHEEQQDHAGPGVEDS